MTNKNTITRQALNRVGLGQAALAALGEHTVGARLTKRRLALGLTQGQVSGKVMFEPKTGPNGGVARPLSRNAYAMYETGVIEPSLRLIEGLAKALRVSPSWLAFGSSKQRTRKARQAWRAMDLSPMFLPPLDGAHQA